MINTERIARLHHEVEQIDQALLDINPNTDLFWELTALKEDKLTLIHRLRTFKVVI